MFDTPFAQVLYSQQEVNNMNDWRINLRLPAELKEPLKKKAKDEDRSVNSMILTIIKKYLEEDGK
jgi:hypothetical protein